MRRFLLAAAFLAAAAPMHAVAQGASPDGDAATIAIRAGALFDGTGEGLQRNVTILVRDGRIVDVGPNVTIPADAERIDLSGWTVMPGFIDLHTHITGGP